MNERMLMKKLEMLSNKKIKNHKKIISFKKLQYV